MARLTVFYDGQCVLCLRTKEILKRLNTTEPLEMTAIQDLTPGQIPGQDNGRIPQGKIPSGLTPELMQSQLHVVDDQGQVYGGAEAVYRILRSVKGLRWIAAMYKLPGLGRLADGLYRLVAKHRYRLFGKLDDCDSGTCNLHR